MTEQILPSMFAAAAPEPELREKFLAMAWRTGPDVFRAQLAAQATRTDASAVVAGLRCPVLVASGERDALCPPAFHETIAAAAPRAQLHLLPGAGHLLPIEATEAVSALLRNWLCHLDEGVACT